MHADLIVLLVDGQVVERGTHDELIAHAVATAAWSKCRWGTARGPRPIAPARPACRTRSPGGRFYVGDFKKSRRIATRRGIAVGLLMAG